MDSARTPIRVAFIVGEFPDKIGTFILNQVTGLLDQGVDVQIFSLLKPREQINSKEIEKYDLMKRVHYIDVPRNKILRALKSIWILFRNLFVHPIKIFKSLSVSRHGKAAITLNPLFFCDYFLRLAKEFDILHCHFGQRGIYGAALRDIGIKGKLITSFYGGDLSYFVDATSKNIYKHLFKVGDLFLSLSENFKNKLIELGCPRSKIKVLPIMIDTSQFMVKHLLTSSKKITILTAARLVEKKGIFYSIKAINNLAKRMSNLEYIIAGDGPLKNEIRKQIAQLKAEKYIKLLTNETGIENMKKLLATSDIFVLMSTTSSDGDTEGTPVVLMEAQLAGLPVVSTYHSGIPEIVKDKVTGFLVPEKDIEGLERKLEILIKNPSLRQKMGKKGREFIKKTHEKNEVIKDLHSKYLRLLNN